MNEILTKVTRFTNQFQIGNYAKGSTILRSGDKSMHFYFVESGAVKMSSVSSKGKNLILHIFFPHSFFSLLTLVNEGVNEYDLIALTDTTVRKIPQTDLIAFLKSDPEVMYDVQLRLLKGLSGLLKRIKQSTQTPALNQVASLLLYFAQHIGSSDQSDGKQIQTLELTVTHQEIADWLGLSRENVSLQMKQLERRGLIRTDKHLITIRDTAGLQTTPL